MYLWERLGPHREMTPCKEETTTFSFSWDFPRTELEGKQTSRSPGGHWAQGWLDLLPVMDMTVLWSLHLSKGTGYRKLPPAQTSQHSSGKAITRSTRCYPAPPSQDIHLLSTMAMTWVTSSIQSMHRLAFPKVTCSKEEKLISIYVSPEKSRGQWIGSKGIEGIRATLCLVDLCFWTSSHEWRLLLFKGGSCSYSSQWQNAQWFQWQRKKTCVKKGKEGQQIHCCHKCACTSALYLQRLCVS